MVGSLARLPQVDWTQIEDVITEAYLVAPPALLSNRP